MSYTELKHHSRQDCPDQPREPYMPPPWDGTPCYLNEKTCQTHYEDSGMGDNVTLTYDWKHFIYEDYDRYLYNRKCALRGPCDMLPCACTARSAHTAARRAAMHARSLTE